MLQFAVFQRLRWPFLLTDTRQWAQLLKLYYRQGDSVTAGIKYGFKNLEISSNKSDKWMKMQVSFFTLRYVLFNV